MASSIFPVLFSKSKRVIATAPFDPTAVSGFLRYFDTSLGKVFIGTGGTGTEATADGAAVGSVVDNTGTVLLTLISAGQEMTLRTAGPNGYRYLESGANKALRAVFTLTQPFTRFDVFRLRAGYTLANYWIDGQTPETALLRPYPAGNVSLYSGTGSAPQAPYTDGTWVVTCSVFNGASSIISVNGGSEVTGNPGTGNPGGMKLNNTSFPITTGDWIASWFYNVALSGTNRTNIVNNLKTRYGT